jgi:hypothetical protein
MSSSSNSLLLLVLLLFLLSVPFLAKAGTFNALDSVSLEPSDYGIISFAVEPSGPENQSISLIQVKKINTLFSWFHQVSPASISCWMDWTYLPFRPGTLCPHLFLRDHLQLLSLYLSAIYDFCKSIKPSVSDYQVFKEDHL